MSIQNEKLVNLADAKVLYDDLRGRVEDVDNQVIISGTQPTEEGNKLWVKSSGAGSSIEVPSYAEFEALQTSVEKYVVELTVEFDPQSYYPNFNQVTCNHTIAEMTEAYNAGKEIVGILDLGAQKIGMQTSVMDANDGGYHILQFSFATQTVGDGGIIQIMGYLNGNTDTWLGGMYMQLYANVSDLSHAQNTSFLAMGGKISYLGDPADNQDAATKKYVDGAVAAPNPYLAPVEPTATSTRAYAVGDIFVCKGITGGLCKATSAIAIGDTIVAGSSSGCNCVVIDNLVTNIPKDVQINGTSIVSNGVANIPYAGSSTAGLIKVGAEFVMASGQTLRLQPAATGTVKTGTSERAPISVAHQHEAAFYGLAKAAGDATQAASSNAVGTYTDGAKTSIQTMLSVLDRNVIAKKYEDLTFPIQEGSVCEHNGGLYITLTGIEQQEEWTSAHWQSFGNDVTIANVAGSAYVLLFKEVLPTVRQLPYVLPMYASMDQITSAESTFTSTKAYAVGDLFAYVPQDGSSSSKLLRATSAIAIGDTIVPGASSGCNCEEVILTNVVPHDVQIDGTSIVNNGVANIPKASSSTLGTVKVNGNMGIYLLNDVLTPNTPSDAEYKAGANSVKPIVPNKQHFATFYGLAKAAGDSTQASSSNAVGTYTDDAKAAIKTMLGVEDPDVSDVQINGTSIVNNGVANIPIADSSTLGAIQTGYAYGIKVLTGSNAGKIAIDKAPDANVKAGTHNYYPIVPYNQDMATFYGLAKIAGHDEKDSTLQAGQYTPEAKAAIQTMIGVDPGVVFVEQVTGTTPTITGVANTRYVCGEVAELTITPPASGTIDVRFTSGTTPTVLTIPSTVKFPDWVDLTTIEASTTYEIMITDGVYGGVMTWPV